MQPSFDTRRSLVAVFLLCLLALLLQWASLLSQTEEAAVLANTVAQGEPEADQLIRIHVLANSDSAQDQWLKLQARDAVLQYLQPLLAQSHSLQESRHIILQAMPQIGQAASKRLRLLGSTAPVTLQYGHFDFPPKVSGQLALPAGRYEALRILIGEGAGQNWWCVLFPPLCFADDTSQQEPAEGITLKWRGLSLWQSLTKKEAPTP